VEKQTLKEASSPKSCGQLSHVHPSDVVAQAIEEGLQEERVWVLFRQILDALEHIASWEIVRAVPSDFVSCMR